MSIKSDVARIFETSKPMEKIYVDDLMNELDLEKLQIQNTISTLLRDGYPLEVVHRGACWVYTGERNDVEMPQNELQQSMVLITTTPKGSRILEDENGGLWIAKKFDE